jgi:hypothetical protein
LRKVLLLVVFVLALSIGMNPVTSSASIADGTYNLNYQVNEFKTNSASIANDYFLKPAKLIVSNGNMKVQITIKKSSWVTAFNPPGGATVVSTNASANQRVVQFNIANFNSITVGMKVDIEEGDLSYHHTYNTDFMFFEDSLKLVQAGPKPVENTKPNTSEANGNNQSSNNQQVNNPQNSKPNSATENSQDNSSPSNTQPSSSSSSSDTQDEGTSTSTSSEDSADEGEQTNEQESNPDTADPFPYIYVLLLIGSIMLLVINKKYIKS